MDGNRANKILTEILAEQGFENLLTYQHAPYGEEADIFEKDGDLFMHFQLDASASIPGCIAEMLLQSHMGELHLLPALPDEFASGSITGLKARGGFKIDMEWAHGQLIEATITKPADKETPRIRLGNDVVDLLEFPSIRVINQ